MIFAVPAGSGAVACSTAFVNPGACARATSSGRIQLLVRVAIARATSTPAVLTIPIDLLARIALEDIKVELVNGWGDVLIDEEVVVLEWSGKVESDMSIENGQKRHLST